MRPFHEVARLQLGSQKFHFHSTGDLGIRLEFLLLSLLLHPPKINNCLPNGLQYPLRGVRHHQRQEQQFLIEGSTTDTSSPGTRGLGRRPDGATERRHGLRDHGLPSTQRQDACLLRRQHCCGENMAPRAGRLAGSRSSTGSTKMALTAAIPTGA